MLWKYKMQISFVRCFEKLCWGLFFLKRMSHKIIFFEIAQFMLFCVLIDFLLYYANRWHFVILTYARIYFSCLLFISYLLTYKDVYYIIICHMLHTNIIYIHLSLCDIYIFYTTIFDIFQNRRNIEKNYTYITGGCKNTPE